MTVIENPDFNIGLDYSGLAPLDAAIPGMPSQPLDSFGVGIGSVSADTGISPPNDGERQIIPGLDAMAGLDSDGRYQFYDDQPHPAPAGGMDANQGLAAQGGIVQEAILNNSDMWLQPQNTFDHETDQGHDLLAGESMPILDLIHGEEANP